jgi:alkanesulfonate monooxygenase
LSHPTTSSAVATPAPGQPDHSGGGLRFHWFLPTSGDGRHIVGSGVSAPVGADTASSPTFREPTLDYLAHVARTAEQLGYESVLTPTGTYCQDPWVVTAALLPQTSRLHFLVAFRPGLLSPTLAAQMAAAYQQISGGRLRLNIVTGGDPQEQRRFGDFLSHTERYARTDEFLQVVRGAWSGELFDFAGEHYTVEGATVVDPPDPVPPVYFGGASPAALPVAARHADTYLTWGEPPAAVGQRLDAVRVLAREQGRTLEFGIRLHVITRDSAAEAWAEADRLVSQLSPEAIEAAQAGFRTTESVGQRRMAELSGGRLDRLEVSPNLWAGFGLVRPGAGTALVGSHDEVADRIAEYAALGIDHFILSGQPHVEEAYWFAENVRPRLAARGLVAGGQSPEARRTRFVPVTS